MNESNIQTKNFLDAIEILIDKKLKNNLTQIVNGVINQAQTGNVKVYGIDYNLPVYGNAQNLTQYQVVKVIIPQGQMSQAFILPPIPTITATTTEGS